MTVARVQTQKVEVYQFDDSPQDPSPKAEAMRLAVDRPEAWANTGYRIIYVESERVTVRPATDVSTD